MIFQSTTKSTYRDVDFKIASTRDERFNAFRLVHDAYVRAGLEEVTPSRMRVTPYQLLNTTEIFVAKLRDEIIATISLVRDSESGLPMELVFPQQVAERRQAGVRLAEATCLADRRGDASATIPVFCEICRLMVQTARARNIDELLVAVHPRHVRFYKRLLAFEVISTPESYPAVRHQPAVAMSLDFKRIDVEQPFSYNRFFGEAISPRRLQRQTMTATELEFLRDVVSDDFGAAPIGPKLARRNVYNDQERRESLDLFACETDKVDLNSQ